jgi:hypothetical protein
MAIQTISRHETVPDVTKILLLLLTKFSTACFFTTRPETEANNVLTPPPLARDDTMLDQDRDVVVVF